MESGKENVNFAMAKMALMAEMVHAFYVCMIEAGASKEEANAAMNGFIIAFWADHMGAIRQKNRENADEE